MSNPTMAQLKQTAAALDRDARRDLSVSDDALHKITVQAEIDAADEQLVERDMSQDVPKSPKNNESTLPNLTGSPAEIGLTGQQRMALALLFAGHTHLVVAERLGIDRRTLYRWRQLPEFQEAYRRQVMDSVSTAAARVRKLLLRATATLEQAFNGPDKIDWAFRLVSNRRVWHASVAAFQELREAKENLDNSPSASNNVSG